MFWGILPESFYLGGVEISGERSIRTMIDQDSPTEEQVQSERDLPGGGMPPPGPLRLEMLDKLLEEVRHTDSRQSLDLCTEGLRLAEHADRPADVAFLLCMRGEAYFRLSDYHAAKVDARQACRMYQEIGRLDGQAQVLLTLAGSCTQLGEYEEARGYLLEALAVAESLESPLWMGMTLNYLGILYDQLGEYDRAATFYLEGLALQEEEGDGLGQASSLANLGWVSYESEDYQGALDYYRRSLAMFRERGDRYGLCVTLNSLGDIHFKLDEYQLSLSNHLESLCLAQDIGDRYQESGSLNSIGKLHFHVGEFELAVGSFRQSLEVKEQIGDRQGMVDVLLNVGLLHTRKGELDRAIQHLDRALALADEIQTRAFTYRIHEALSEVYERKGDPVRALEHYKQFHRLRAEVMGAEAEKRVRLLQTRLAIEKLEKESELVRLNAERMEHELHLARRVQIGLHPAGAPRIGSLDIASVSLPAFEAGGDYYDFFRLGERRLGLAIGDVSGKGLPAAIYMTLVKGVMKAYAASGASPRMVLEQANAMIYESFSRGWFISMIYAIIDMDTRTLTYARGGHNPPLLFSEHTRSSSARASGMALGLASTPLFADILTEVTLPLHPGDALLLYTDGFTEAMNGDKEELGDERFEMMVRRNLRHPSASAMLEGIQSDLKGFIGSAAQHDDMTMIMVRIGDSDG